MSAAEVDAYVASLPEPRAGRVGAVVAAVRRIAPEAEQAIDYRMPVFRRGDDYFAVASQKNYISLYLGTRPGLADRVIASDPKLKGGKSCVNVRDTVMMPIAALEAVLPELFGG